MALTATNLRREGSGFGLETLHADIVHSLLQLPRLLDGFLQKARFSLDDI